jgi:hypothetical protein
MKACRALKEFLPENNAPNFVDQPFACRVELDVFSARCIVVGRAPKNFDPLT